MDDLNFSEEDFSKLTLEEIKVLLDGNINKIKVDDRVLIFYLIENNQIELIEKLIDVLDLNSAEESYGHTPLSWACCHDYFEIVKLIVEKFKVSKTVNHNINGKSRYGNTPLYWSCYHENFEMIKFLLENGAISEVDEGGNYKCLMYFTGEFKEKLQDFIFKIQSLNIKKVK